MRNFYRKECNEKNGYHQPLFLDQILGIMFYIQITFGEPTMSYHQYPNGKPPC